MLEQFEDYRQNVTPTMLKDLAKQLGLSTYRPFQELGIGYAPLERAWIIPERNSRGKIIGLQRRFFNDKKYMVEGSKRGLVFAVNPEFFGPANRYYSGSMGWKRVTKESPCPICGREKWCTVAEDDSAVRCPKTQKGSVRHLGDWGYLHILSRRMATGPIIYPSEHPLVITEGFSDWAMAEALGFRAIGQPNATASKELLPLVTGKEIIIFGDNNEVGQRGVEATDHLIRDKCLNVTKFFPPAPYKDFREWVSTEQLLLQDIFDLVLESGETKPNRSILSGNEPMTIARNWLQQEHTQQGIPVLRSYGKIWYDFIDGVYQEISEEKMRGELYRFLDKMVYIKDNQNNKVAIPVKPDKTKVNNIVDALSAWCPIPDDPPVWLKGSSKPKASDLILFKNGMLDVSTGQFIPATPHFFALSASPHTYDPNIKADKRVMEIVADIMQHDERKIRWLQELAGYCLVSDQSLEKIFILVGQPGSGKGTILTLLTSLLGNNQVVSTDFGHLCSQWGYGPLLGKLVAYMPDAELPRNLDSGQALEKIKSISGGDPVSIQRRYLPALPNVKLYCRFIISINTLPDLPDHAGALARRLELLVFRNSYFGREDRTIKNYLAEKADTLIPWALEGLQRIRETKQFTELSDSIEMIREFKIINTPMMEFVETCCEFDEDSWIEKMQLYNCFCSWQVYSGQKAVSAIKFRQKLLALHPNIKTHIRNIPPNRLRVEGYQGIRFSSWVKQNFRVE